MSALYNHCFELLRGSDLSPKQVPKVIFIFVSSADLEVVFFPLETHSLMVPDGYFYILCQLQWHEN